MSDTEIEEIQISQSSEPMQVGSRAEVDVQIATAHAYPRSVAIFKEESTALVTENEVVAESCFYALPRDGKTIEGPSIRFAEIVAACWGNLRTGGRVVGEDAEFVLAQGVAHDLQRNLYISIDVRRRIANKHGRRYNADMIATTGNAAVSIALRNAILRVIPEVFWGDQFYAARKTAIGDITTLANRREDCVNHFAKMGVTEAQVCAAIGKERVGDIGLDELATLRGFANALRDGDASVESVFPGVVAKAPTNEAKGVGGLAARLGQGGGNADAS